METLDNGTLRVRVSGLGAELQSIVKGGKEYLWQGNPAFWGRRSPVLFPIVGRVWGDEYRYKGKTWQLGQHGFARDMDFRRITRTESSVLYRLESDERTLEKYPCPFRLDIGYALSGNAVEVSWIVENTGNGDMDFQIGAHPAFYFPAFDHHSKERCLFAFDNPGELTYIVPKEKGCSGPEGYTLQRGGDGYMAVDTSTFACDTYIFENGQLHKVTLCTPDRVPYISVEFDAPLVALWSPTAKHSDCPFVCIEPWYGRCDRVGFDGDFRNREWMQHLGAGAVFKASYRIVVH